MSKTFPTNTIETHREVKESATNPSLRRAQYKRQAQDKHRPQRGGEDDAYFDSPSAELRTRLSTGLKVLSRITEPTEGYAEIHGRVGSLLEACPERGRRVGTGFHPTPLCPPAGRGMTGRENIYLNGAIPSLRQAQYKRHAQDRPGDEEGGDLS